VFAKQQGAFVAAGAVGLVPLLWGRGRPWRRGLGDAATLVATAIAVFALAMALDGGGVAALRIGTATAVTYGTERNFLANLAFAALHSPALFAVWIGAVCLWPMAFILSRRQRSDGGNLLLTVWAMGAATAILTLLQFSRRGYPHYALLTVPFALLAIAMALSWSWDVAVFWLERAGEKKKRSRLALGVSAFGLLAGVLGGEALAPLAARGGAEVLSYERYAAVCRDIEPGRRLLLLPSRENALHWACGTHARGTRFGYGYLLQRPGEYIEELAKPELSQVFVFKNDDADPDEQAVAMQQPGWSSFFTGLAQSGFRPVAQTDAGTLYRRDSNTLAHEEVDHGHE
jgi:hypothetical protein